jgi:hypothetical protein
MPGTTLPDPPQQDAATPAEKVTLSRLEDQIKWYAARSAANQRSFKLLKAITIVSAAVIPVFTTSGVAHGAQIAAALGVLIVVVEGLQQLNQYQANWTSYRLTAEALKHEKFLYFAKAGSYASAANPGAELAERVESLISQEESKWMSMQTPRSKP